MGVVSNRLDYVIHLTAPSSHNRSGIRHPTNILSFSKCAGIASAEGFLVSRHSPFQKPKRTLHCDDKLELQVIEWKLMTVITNLDSIY